MATITIARLGAGAERPAPGRGAGERRALGRGAGERRALEALTIASPESTRR
ncbi:hypothetical protein ACLKM7_18440 [Microbacterium sp. I2]|jgi:hypothetical protein|uniref:hypothetical protein n=1 Tax=Microbacterium sp. I2 TaxID=3391826 RepID=UPI003ED83EC4